jgi:site-specific DNA-methyltransferase (adenine-specific)
MAIEKNKVYQMDNLSLLKSMPESFVDLIYCDILFGTGKKFKDYQDIKPIKQSVYDFYTPRIEEMKRVLKDTGNIFLHMDYRINHWIRDIMDSVFGYKNFRNEIIWSYNSAPRKKSCFGNRHDTIFRYTKTDEFYFDDTQVREPYSETAPRGYEKEKYYNPLGKVMGDVWQINILGQNDKTERVGYDTQKPKKLIEPIIKSCCPKDGLFADFFCGSGTSLVVAKELGIDYIGCDIGERAVEVSNMRLEKVK